MSAALKTIDNPPVVMGEGATMLAVLTRAASDPNTDVDKLERLGAMYERMEAKRAEAEFNAALSAMQTDLPAVNERGNAAGRYTYALWEDINAKIKPVMQAHGFALSFRTDFADGIAVTAVLSHRTGHSERTTIKLPADPSGNKNAVQAVASSVSYGKRYTAGALLNLTSHGEDDDAFAAVSTYDATGWYDEIASAVDMARLNALAAELKAADVPKDALRNIRAAWSKRSKEVAG